MQLNSIVENIEDLPVNQQTYLVNILKKRITERKRGIIKENANKTQNAYQSGKHSEENAVEIIKRLSEDL